MCVYRQKMVTFTSIQMNVCVYIDNTWWHVHLYRRIYGVATVSRIDKIIGLFCRISSLYRALLQKRLIILSILPTKATPYVCVPTIYVCISIIHGDMCVYTDECMCVVYRWTYVCISTIHGCIHMAPFISMRVIAPSMSSCPHGDPYMYTDEYIWVHT